jgi:hypothetical protein
LLRGVIVVPWQFLSNVRRFTHLLFLACCVCCATGALPASAGDFDIVINVHAGDEQFQTLHTHETPSEQQPPTRKIVPLTHGTPVRVTWTAQNTDKTRECQNVLVHFFVVKEKEAGQAEVPKLTQDVAYEGALTMDFKPREKATWNFDLAIREPGNYLLRVETIGLLVQHKHEHYAALDLVVK